ncbi:MAG: glycosyltransferase, partial [Acidobacteria bacterium]|nr:glycosyltransferase [Acidobacteriota bacterium]
MSTLETVILAAYFATLSILAIYGCHRYYLLRLYCRHRSRPARPAGRLEPLPFVTVQLPIYNEVYVVKRLIRAACALDYPADRLEIQVLDDSTDETTQIAAETIAALRGRGPDIRHIRRGGRAGYKAGALAHGLNTARGEFIAIFDADFVPPPGFLLDLLPHFSRPRVGMVQARWEHLNRDYSFLTRIQSILLDGHFVIEHAARHRAGRFFNFNGTAGIWRRSCIESAGGWQDDTLTEDLDLSYRAQLAGWEFVFVPDVVAPAELPADMASFKSQQHRWTCGSIQTGFKILPRLLRSRLPFGVKAEAFFHLTNNCAYALMAILAILVVPAMVVRQGVGRSTLLFVDLPLFLMSTISVSAFYLISQREVRDDWVSTLAFLPGVMSVGIGLSLNNARAVLAACRGRRAEFARTPKYSLEGTLGDWRDKRYRGPRQTGGTATEMIFGIYFTMASIHAIRSGMYASLPFYLLFQAGFLYTALLSLA